MKLVWQSEARRELREALAYYRDRTGLEIGKDFRLAAMRAGERLLDHPDIGVMAGHGV